MNRKLLQQALKELETRLARIEYACTLVGPKQAIGEMLAAMREMPEWNTLRTELAKTDPEPVAVYRFSVPMQEYGVKWLITSELPDNTSLYLKEQL